MSEVVQTLDQGNGQQTTLAEEKVALTSIACHSSGQAIGARRLDEPLTGFELVQLDGSRVQLLTSGAAVGGARLAATVSGFVAGLGLAPTALVATAAPSSGGRRPPAVRDGA